MAFLTEIQLEPMSAEAQANPAVARLGVSWRRFLLWFLLLPALLYFAAFAIVRSHSYEHWSRSQWGPMLDFAFETGPQNADVLIFGDSSAFIGVDPRLVQAELGVKTLVLPNTVGSLPVTGDLALERYLETNAPPKLLVLYFSAWNLDYAKAEDVRLFEGEEMLFRHAGLREIAAFTRRRPLETLAFPLRLYSTFGPRMIQAMMAKQDRERSTALALGHVDDPDPFPPLPASCTLPAKLLNAGGSAASVEALARKYSSAGTRVMIYLAPVPHCGNSGAILSRSYSVVGAEPPAELPARGFLADPNFAHIEPAFVPQSTRLLTDAVGRRLGIPVSQSARLTAPTAR